MIGDTFGGYLVLERLGKGGMGAVYKAEDEAGHEVALKVIADGFADDPAGRKRFDHEIEVLRALDQPRIVRALSGLQEHGERLFYAMELVEGEDLSHVLKREGRLGVRRALEIAADVLEALSFAHEQGVFHRDVKPSNVFLDAEGRAKLGDFGLALVAGQSRLTRTGSVLGTPEYMAPEQAEGEEVDACGDVYAVGTVLYEMLAGRPPFTASNALAVLRMQVEREPPPLSQTLPASVREVIARALQKAPADRWPSAGSMREALQKAAEGAPEAVLAEAETAELAPVGKLAAIAQAETRALTTRPEEKEPPRGPSWRSGVVVFVVVLAAGLGRWWWGQDEAPLRLDPPPPVVPSPEPSALVNEVEVHLRSGETFRGELVAIDVVKRELVTRLADGTERAVSLDAVDEYTKLGD